MKLMTERIRIVRDAPDGGTECAIIWIAYPASVAVAGPAERVHRAWGKGDCREAALQAAREARAERMRRVNGG